MTGSTTGSVDGVVAAPATGAPAGPGDGPAAGAMALAARARELSGLEFLRTAMAGESGGAPIGRLLGFELAEVDEGRVVFTLTPTEAHYNPIGGVHGGVYATLLDSATGCAVHSLLPAGVGYTSLDLSVKFLRGMSVATGAAGPVRAEGTVTHLGRRTALAEARLLGPDGRLYATATSSILILRD